MKNASARLHRLQGQLLAILESDLERELANERTMLPPGAPERHVGLGLNTLAEIEHPDVLKHLLDDGIADQLDLLSRLLPHPGEHREDLDQ